MIWLLGVYVGLTALCWPLALIVACLHAALAGAMRRESERKRLADYNYALEWYGEDYAERHYGS